LVAIVGSLCGTTITALVPHTSPQLVLVSAVLGAAIPAFVKTAGRQRPLRIAMTVLATTYALGFTYAGALVVSPVIHEEILPGSDVFSEGPVVDSGIEPPIRVTPDELDCRPGCVTTVAIENVSTEPVTVDGIEFSGPDEHDFKPDGRCEKPIGAGEECAFSVLFDPADPKYDSHANLVISYDAPAGPIVIPATSHGISDESSPTRATDPPDHADLRVEDVACAYLPSPVPTEEGSLLIGVRLTVDGSQDGLPSTITVTAAKDGGQSRKDNATPDSPARITLPVGRTDFGREHEITVIVDSNDLVDEDNEENNTISVHLVLPNRLGGKGTLNC
jgi:hypothetical protein